MLRAPRRPFGRRGCLRTRAPRRATGGFAAALVACALAACGGGAPEVVGGGTTSAAGASTVTTGGLPDPSATVGGSAATNPPVPAGGGADPGTPAPPGATATTPPATTATSATLPVLDGNVGVGRFAPALLRADLSQRLVVEVHADVAPRPATLQRVADVLGAVSAKPVEVVTAPAPGGGARSWDEAAIAAAADAGAVVAQGGGVAVVRLLFLAGDFRGDRGVLGVAVRGDTAAVFVDRVAGAAGLLGSRDPVERSVTVHELGHLLGLVDLYLATGRADPGHPGHSANPDSVMYWAVESDLIATLLGASPPADFDAADLADLAAIGAGA